MANNIMRPNIGETKLKANIAILKSELAKLEGLFVEILEELGKINMMKPLIGLYKSRL